MVLRSNHNRTLCHETHTLLHSIIFQLLGITLIIGSQNIQQLIDFLIRRVEHDFLSRAAKEGGALL